MDLIIDHFWCSSPDKIIKTPPVLGSDNELHQYEGIRTGSQSIPKELSTSLGEILSSGFRASIIFSTFLISSLTTIPE